MYHIFHICGILFSFFSYFSFFSCLSVLVFFLFSQFFPARGACLLLFSLSCPAPLCFSSFSLHFSLPAGHDGSFSHSHAPLRSAFPLFLFTFPCPRGMIAPCHSLMPRSALFSLFSSSLFPARGACLPLFSLSCPAPLCFPSFPLHFSLPAGHVCLFSHSHAPLGSAFPLFLFIFPFLRGMIAPFHSLMPRSALFSFFSSSLFPARGACLLLFTLPCPARLCFPSFPLHFSLPAGHVCYFSHSHAPLGHVLPLFLFTFPCPRGMFASFLTLMPRSALFSQIASSVILVRSPAPLYNTRGNIS